eukprot:scaffold39547_cov57-Phaeocystis_antarctica.AAC.3
MPVTLDVSRFSGWLKADASCRVKKGAYKPRYMRLEVYARKALGAATAQEVLCAWKGLDYRDWAQDTHVAHPKHAAHSCDIGRVETQRLVERRRTLPSRRRRAQPHVGCRTQLLDIRKGQGTRGAHPKHARHACDAGRVEAQRLVECRCLLPSRKGGHTKQGRGASTGKPDWTLGAEHERCAPETCRPCL